MTDNSTRHCPYWVALTGKCTRNDGGLFIPMEDHVARCCSGGQFTTCPQYRGDAAAAASRRAAVTAAKNRRSSARIDQQKWVTFAARLRSRLNPDLKTEATRNLKAKTLDISSGGMRLFTSTPLTEQSLIEFSFGRDFPVSLHHALGKVQWCNKQIDEPGYQVGIAFTEGDTSHAMEGYLSQLPS